MAFVLLILGVITILNGMREKNKDKLLIKKGIGIIACSAIAFVLHALN